MQRQYHENIQQIIGRQKQEFDDFLLQNGLKLIKTPSNEPSTKENVEYFPARDDDTITDNLTEGSDVDDNEFFSLVGELKIDQSDSDNVMHHQIKNDDSDGEQYFSLPLSPLSQFLSNSEQDLLK